MANDVVNITEGAGKSIDTRTTAANARDRQVIVVGNPTVDVAVAEVASLDVGVGSTAYGQMVRLAGSAQVNIVSASVGSIAIHILSTGGTIAANIGKVDGTVAVYLHSTGGTLGVNVGKIEGTSAIYLHSTGGTIGVRVGQIDGSVAVYFNQSGPAVRLADSGNANLAAITPQAGATAGNALQVLGGQYNTALGVNPAAGQPVFLQTDASARVIVSNIINSIAVHLLSTGGTIRVGDIPGTTAVYFSPSEPTIKGITNSIAVHLLSTNGTIRVGDIPGSVAVYFSPSLPTIKGISDSIAIYLGATAGTVAVKLDPGYNVVNISSTIVLPRTVSGSTSGVSASGVQLVAPDAGNNIKVFAYSIQSTSALSQVIKFTNGGGTPTELWRPLVTAGSVTGVQGANGFVVPPGYIFATGVNTTLAIVTDGSLVHYSVGYFKESS